MTQLLASTALVTDHTWTFFLVLVIILCAPMLLSRLRIPHIIGLILAGVLVGQYGFNVLERDASFELFGQVGIYYIMFLAGLELNMGSVVHYGRRGIQYGLLTFAIPFIMGFAASYWLLDYDVKTSLMLSCLLSSHTLVSYPIVSRFGLARHRAVVIAVVATAFTTFLSLLVLAFVVGSLNPDAGLVYWLLFALKCTAYGAVTIFVFPWLGRRFLRRYDDSVMQFVFVLALVFLSAALAKVAGLEGLLGAFLAGLVINRLIPHTSPLMNRLEFVGNALFIPYFLIGVGMIIDVRVLFGDASTLKVVAVVVAVAMLSKWVAAWLMNLSSKGSAASRQLMFGLSNAHAAGALAIVMIGTDIGLMDPAMLNATVTLILFSCIVSSIATSKGARHMALADSETRKNQGAYHGKCLVTFDHPETVSLLTQLALIIRNPFVHDSLMGLSVDYESNEAPDEGLGKSDNAQLQRSKSNLLDAQRIAASADVQMSTLSRVSTNVASGILHTMKEHDVGEVVLGMHLLDGNAPAGSLGTVVDGVLTGSHREVMVVHPIVTPGTIRNVVVVVPQKAEYEVGFYKWLEHVCRIGEQLDCHLRYHAFPQALRLISEYMREKHRNVRATYHELPDWTELLTPAESGTFDVSASLAGTLGKNDMLVVVTSRPGFLSYIPAMDLLPRWLANHFSGTSVMILYPDQSGDPTESMTIFSPNGMAVTRGMSTSTLGKIMALRPKRKRKKKKKK